MARKVSVGHHIVDPCLSGLFWGMVASFMKRGTTLKHLNASNHMSLLIGFLECHRTSRTLLKNVVSPFQKCFGFPQYPSSILTDGGGSEFFFRYNLVTTLGGEEIPHQAFHNYLQDSSAPPQFYWGISKFASNFSFQQHISECPRIGDASRMCPPFGFHVHIIAHLKFIVHPITCSCWREVVKKFLYCVKG